jgi:hypothetical protein
MGPSAALKTTYANGRKTVAPTSNASSMLTAPVAAPSRTTAVATGNPMPPSAEALTAAATGQHVTSKAPAALERRIQRSGNYSAATSGTLCAISVCFLSGNSGLTHKRSRGKVAAPEAAPSFPFALPSPPRRRHRPRPTLRGPPPTRPGAPLRQPRRRRSAPSAC